MIEQHRTMELPGAGIVRDPGPTTLHAEYPKHMRHPAYRRGKPDKEIKVTDENGQPTGRLVYMGGESIRFPPVLVLNEAQEEFHKSQGYETVGKSDPAAFARLVADAEPVQENYKPIEFPKWSHGKLVQDAAEEADHLEALGIDKMGRPVEAKATSEPATDEPTLGAEANTLEVWPVAEEDEIAALEAKLAALKAKKAVDPDAPHRDPQPEPGVTTVVVPAVDDATATKEAKNAARVAKIKATMARKKAEKESAALQDEVQAESA